MDRHVRERMVRNELRFREVNEAIERGRTARMGPVTFVCECARLGCTTLVELTLAEYREVRAHPRRFVLAVGHEVDAIERVVSRHERYVVVEKDERLLRGP